MEHNKHVFYMQKALMQARRALERQEVPIGAIVVDKDGAVVARAYNQVEGKNTQVAHAEMLAIEKAGKRLGDWRLQGCTLYVTLEPCAMCMGLVMLSKVDRVVYGAPSPEFGYHLDNCISLNLYKRKIELISGICGNEAAEILRSFFKRRRRGREEK